MPSPLANTSRAYTSTNSASSVQHFSGRKFLEKVLEDRSASYTHAPVRHVLCCWPAVAASAQPRQTVSVHIDAQRSDGRYQHIHLFLCEHTCAQGASADASSEAA
jgi:hypothetical protein